MMQFDAFDIETLADHWSTEPPVGDDTRFLTWAEPGWHSWNLASPEVEFCEFVGSAVTMLRPKFVAETGTGQGFVTRRIASRLYGNGRLVTFEQSDPWRVSLATIPFFDGKRVSLSDRPTPGAEDFAAAELTVLDSEGPLRLAELRLWAEVAQPGAVVIAHDAGNGHPDFSHHAALARLIGELDIAGLFLRNARGAFIGARPGRLPVSRTAPPEVFHWYRSA
jgi:hypothetical protein